MNQQRGRRFRSAREAEDVVRKALQKGVVLPSEPRLVIGWSEIVFKYDHMHV